MQSGISFFSVQEFKGSVVISKAVQAHTSIGADASVMNMSGHVASCQNADPKVTPYALAISVRAHGTQSSPV